MNGARQLLTFRLPSRGRRSGMTIVEMMVAVLLGSILPALLFSLMLMLGRMQRVSYYETRVFQQADILEDEITRILQNAHTSSIWLNPADADGAYFKSINFSKGIGVNPINNQMWPNERLTYNATTKVLTYDPDVTATSNERVLGMAPKSAPSSWLTLDRVWFYNAKPNSTDTSVKSVILVTIQVTDNGKGRQTFRNVATGGSANANRITCNRTFAVVTRKDQPTDN